MFRIFENGTEIGVADKLTFIKKADNGCFVLCAEDEAQGIAFNGETFTLGTNGGIENAREAQFCEVSTADEVQNAKTVNGITFVTMAEAGSIDAVTAAEHAELFQEWAYPFPTRWVKFVGIKEFFINVFRLTVLQPIGHLTQR